MTEYHFVGHIYHGRVVYEGKELMNDHFLVIDEYMRPPMGNFDSHEVLYCLLMSITTGNEREVVASRLKRGPHYMRVG